jgi:hypothetical protein
VEEASWFFITINCHPRTKNQLCDANVGEAVLAAVTYNHDNLLWHCRLCLLMPDHLHAVIAFPRDPGMAKVIANWKKFVATKIGIKLATRLFRSPLAHLRRRGRKNQLHSAKPRSQTPLRTRGRLALGLPPRSTPPTKARLDRRQK